MKKGKKIALICVAVLLVALVAIGIWQRNNLKAAWYYASMDREQTQEKIDQNEKELLDSVGLQEAPTAQLTEEQIQELADGTLSVDDAVTAVLQQGGTAATDGSSSSPQDGGGNSSAATSQSGTNTDAQLQKLVARLYVLKASFTGQLESLVSQAKSEYSALPDDQKTGAAKRKIATGKLSAVASLESSCDSQVSAIVEEVRSVLKAAGRDTSLADRIAASYQEEKSLKKAYYMSQLG